MIPSNDRSVMQLNLERAYDSILHLHVPSALNSSFHSCYLLTIGILFVHRTECGQETPLSLNAKKSHGLLILVSPDSVYIDNRTRIVDIFEGTTGIILEDPKMPIPEEQPLITYARFHGIAIEHFVSDPLNLIRFDSEELNLSLEDPPDAPHVDLKTFFSSISSKQKKINSSRNGAIMLSYVTRPLIHPDEIYRVYDDYLPNRHRLRSMKMVQPVLSSDCEFDILSFCRQKYLKEIQLTHLDLSLELVDDDASLSFPHILYDIWSELQGKLAREKMDCTRGILLCLQKARQTIQNPMEYLEQYVDTYPVRVS